MRKNRLAMVLAVTAGLALAASAAAAQPPPQAAENTGKFRLNDDGAELVREPGVRPTNHVLRIDTSEDELFGSMSRPLDVAPEELDGALSFDYFIASGDCGGGSPRLTLSVDNSGNGEHDFFLMTDGSGSPGWEPCPQAHEEWVSFNATDDGNTYWRIHPGTDYYNWSNAKGALDEDAEILSGAIVDDSYWKEGAAGVAFYDNVQIGDRTFTGPQDVLSN